MAAICALPKASMLLYPTLEFDTLAGTVVC
jgi:hypothetical protein